MSPVERSTIISTPAASPAVATRTRTFEKPAARRKIEPQALPPDATPPPSVRGELAPGAGDAVMVRDLEFLSWYSQRHEAGTPAADVLPELPETMSDGEPPEANDAQ